MKISKWALIAILILAAMFGYHYLNQKKAEDSVWIEKTVQKNLAEESVKLAAQSYQSKLPITVDDGLKLIVVEYDEKNKEMVYSYKDSYISKFSVQQIKDYEKEWKSRQIDIGKKSQNKDAFIDGKISSRYMIFDEANNLRINILVTPEEIR